MPKMLRFTEAQFHTIMASRMSGETLTHNDEPEPTPGILGQNAASGAANTGSRINAPAHSEKGGLVMLPYPVGANRVWRTVRGRVIANPKAEEWKRLAAGLMSGRVMFNGDVSVEYILHPRKNKNGSSSKTRLDVDAPAKALLDALSGVCYHDDKQVIRLTGCIGEPVINGGLSVGVMAA